jgi:hypothetical protein
MTVKLIWQGIAEGAAVDPRGALHLIGFQPPFLAIERVPGQLNVVLVLVCEDDGLPEPVLPASSTVAVRMQITAPDGEVIMALRQDLTTPPKRYDNLPYRVQFVGTVPVPVTKTGSYRFTLSLLPADSDPVGGEVEVPILEQQLPEGLSTPG